MRVEILGQVKTLVSDHRHNKSVLQHLHKMEIDDLQDQLTFPNRSIFHNYLQAVIEIILAITHCSPIECEDLSKAFSCEVQQALASTHSIETH